MPSFISRKWLVRLKSFSSWKSVKMQLVDCTLFQHQHSRSMSTAPALSLIKDWRFQKFLLNTCACTDLTQQLLISFHSILRGSRKSYLGTKSGLKKEKNNTGGKKERGQMDNAGRRQKQHTLLATVQQWGLFHNKHNAPDSMLVTL